MADTLHFSLVSPERRVFDEQVERVSVPGEEGVFEVLPKHAPFMATIHPGMVIATQGGQERKVLVIGGFAEVTPEGLSILAEEAFPLDGLDASAIAGRLKTAEADLEAADSDEKRLVAQKAVDQLRQLAG